MNKFEFRYIVLGGGLGEYYDYAYRQVNELEGNLYDGKFPWNRLVQLLNRIHFSNKINSCVKLPFKKIWVYAFLKYIEKKVNLVGEKQDKICFVFFRNWFFAGLLEHNLVMLLRKKYPNCKIVFYIQDQVGVSGIPLELLKNNSDLIIYYDKEDAKKQGGQHYDVPYSSIEEFEVAPKEISSDVFFVGYAKNRYDDIISVYEVLKEKGLVCDFNIIGVQKEKRLYENEINYEKVLSYKENLEKVGRTRCVLEVIQKESVGNTLRVYEAIMLDKLLLSNNQALKENSLFDERYMYIYDNIQNISTDFIRNSERVCYTNKACLYPENLLYFIEERLMLQNLVK